MTPEQERNESPQPIFFARKAFGGKNSEIREHHYPDGTRLVVTRLGARKGGFTFEEAHTIVEDVNTYQHALLSAGVPVPPLQSLYVEYEPDINRSVVVKTSPWAGHEVYSILRDANPIDDIEKIETLTREIADIIIRVATERIDEWHVETGIDPHCSNFVVDESGAMSYVDLFPPRIHKNGKAIVEWPNPKTELGYELGYFKHFDIRGIVLGAIAQLSRVQPTLRALFEEILFDALKRAVSADAYRAFISEIETMPWKKIEAILKSDTEEVSNDVENEIRNAANVVLCGRTYNIYSLREIAIILASRGYMTRDALEDFFHESHFEDTLPEEKLALLIDTLAEHSRTPRAS